MSERGRAEIALILVTIIWGASFVTVKNAIAHTSTMVFLAMRFSLATAALLFLFRRRILWEPHHRANAWKGGLLAGVCLILGYSFQTFGLHFTTASKSAFLTGLTTVLVPFLSAVVYRKAPHLSEGIGVIVATVGMALLTLPPGRLSISVGDALTLCCAVAFACHILVLGKWSPHSSFELLCTVQIAVTAVLALVICPWMEPVKISWSWNLAAALVITGLFATALAFTVQAWAQRHTSPTRAALIFAIEPVSAAVTSYLVDGETLSGKALVGALLILGGVLIVELKPIGLRQHPLG